MDVGLIEGVGLGGLEGVRCHNLRGFVVQGLRGLVFRGSGPPRRFFFPGMFSGAFDVADLEAIRLRFCRALCDFKVEDFIAI